MESRAARGVSHLAELTALVLQCTVASGESSSYLTAIDGLSLLRSDPLQQPSQCMIKPALCMTLQGKKAAIYGSKVYEYSAGYGLVVALEMPESGTVCATSKTEPYLGIVLELDLQILQELVEAGPTEARGKATGPFTLELNHQLIDCALRAVQLFTTPEAISTLYPGIMREICYWLLRGPGGDQLQHNMIRANGQDGKLMEAIQYLRNHFRESVAFEDLARAAHMSPTTFHRRFKAMTSMAPLQYQKQLRLFEARRLMISEHAMVDSAAFEVGYASVSQFSREYTRTFGNPPRREVTTWRSTQPAASVSRDESPDR